MDLSISTDSLNTLACDCLVVPVVQKEGLTDTGQALDKLLEGALQNILDDGDISGKRGQTLITRVTGITCKRIMLLGIGDKALAPRRYKEVILAALKAAKAQSLQHLAFALGDVELEQRGAYWKARYVAETLGKHHYQYTQTKSAQKTDIHPGLVTLISNQDFESACQKGIDQGMALAHGMALSKDLANLPGNVCTPSYLANAAVEMSADHEQMTTNVLEEADMEELGMGSFLSVSRGSREPAKLIVMRYDGGKADDKPIVLVGKGLTFDAGGISLKPAASMDEMKYDMCGGASVIGTLHAIAQMKLPLNVIGIVPASENLPDGQANKPGDIVTSMSGKTIEILNTDAEGRLILCDALTYAERFEPECIIDIATLTGACIIALGHHTNGLLGNDDELMGEILKSAERSHDNAWQLPMSDEYQEQLESNFADIANIGGRPAGTITAACFLSRFTEKQRWAHLDIAGTAWTSGKNKGATGRPVPLLTQFLLDQIKD